MSELNVYHHELRPDEYAEFYLKYEADKVIAEKDAIIEEQAKEIKFMHQHCKYGEQCGTSCAQIHGELMQATIEIAELQADYKEACDRLQTANLIKDEQLAATRHQKYKRCLAMAKLCHWKMGVFIYKEEKSNFYHRWHNRWLKIAEQFKDKEVK